MFQSNKFKNVKVINAPNYGRIYVYSPEMTLL